MALGDLVKEYEQYGCRQMDRSLGIQAMPKGYALMLDADEMYYFWLCEDGGTSVVHWNKWAIRRGAIARSHQ